MRLRWLWIAWLAAGCGGSGGGGGDGDADADADPCGTGRGGAPSVAWAIAGGGPEDDVLSDVALAEDCRGLVASLNHHGHVELGGAVAEGGASWSGLVVRFDATGAVRWTAELAGDGNTLVNALATTDDGGVWAAGSFEETAQLAGEEVTSAGDADAFAVRLDDSGAVEAAVVLGSTGSDVVFTAVATAGGGVVLAGTFGDSLTIGTTTLEVATPAQDVWVAEIDAAGNAVWAAAFGGNGNHNVGYEYPRAVAVTTSGDVAVAGRLANASTPGSWTDDNVAFLRGLSAAEGSTLWERSVPWGYGNWGEVSLAAVPTGGLILGGGFSNVLELGDVSLDTDIHGAVLASVDDSGEPRWVDVIDGPGEENVRDVSPGIEGELLAAGDLESGAVLGAESVTTMRKDAFLAGVRAADGSVDWSLVWSGAGSDDRGTALDAHPRGQIAIGGEVSGVTRLGEVELPHIGGRDVFVAMLRR